MLCDCTAFMDSVLPMTVPDKDPKKILPSREVPPGMLSEQAYYEGLFTHLEKAAGLAVFNFYQRETDDAALFMDWARRTGRKCVFEPDAATLSGIGDAVGKINAVIPGYFGKENLRDLTGIRTEN